MTHIHASVHTRACIPNEHIYPHAHNYTYKLVYTCIHTGIHKYIYACTLSLKHTYELYTHTEKKRT